MSIGDLGFPFVKYLCDIHTTNCLSQQAALIFFLYTNLYIINILTKAATLHLLNNNYQNKNQQLLQIIILNF